MAKVLALEGVTIKTVSFLRVDSGRPASSNYYIDEIGNRLQMIWINAGCVFAIEVIEHKTLRYWGTKNLKTKTMSTYSVSINPEKAVPSLGFAAQPQPTVMRLALVYEFPKTRNV